MATIKEIAELAGVSRGTVDRVLNNRGAVNPQTEEKILRIAEQLDYKPNRAGLVLAAQKKFLKLGVILFGVGNPFFDEVINGIRQKEDELANYNCTILLKRVTIDVDMQLAAIDEMVHEGVNGIAISPTNDPRLAKKIDQLYDMHIPVVTLNTDIVGSKRLAFVGSNYVQAGETAAGLLRLMTHEEVYVGIVLGSSDVLCHTERIEGFERGLEKSDRIRIVETITNDDDDDLSYDRTFSMLQRHPEINALYFAASGVYGGCKAVLALSRQSNMTVLAFDKVDTTVEMLEKGVVTATICQQPFMQGAKPLDILFDYLATGEKPTDEYAYTAIDIRIKENI